MCPAAYVWADIPDDLDDEQRKISRVIWRNAWCTDEDLVADLAAREKLPIAEAWQRIRALDAEESWARAVELVGDAPARIRSLWRLRPMIQSDPVAMADRLDDATYRDVEELHAQVQRATREWGKMRDKMTARKKPGDAP